MLTMSVKAYCVNFLVNIEIWWCKPGHDPSQNLTKICQVLTIHKVYIKYIYIYIKYKISA